MPRRMLLGTALAILAVPLLITALNTLESGYQAGATQIAIDAHGTCKGVSATNSVTYFVPTKTASEWSAFLAHLPASIATERCEAVIDMNVWLATHGFSGRGPGGAGCNMTASDVVGTRFRNGADEFCIANGYDGYVGFVGGAKWTKRMCRMTGNVAAPVMWGDPSCTTCDPPEAYGIRCYKN